MIGKGYVISGKTIEQNPPQVTVRPQVSFLHKNLVNKVLVGIEAPPRQGR